MPADGVLAGDRVLLRPPRLSDAEALFTGVTSEARPTEPHAVEIGYCLAHRCWGQGVMSAAIRLLLDRFDKDSALYRVSAACHVENVRSARVLERAGLALEGRLARYLVFPNLGTEPQDSLLYARALR